MKSLPGTGFSVVMIIVTMAGCLADAEHTNPLDPLSPTFVDEGHIEGRIVDRSLAGIAGATVIATPGGASALSEADGRFVLNNIPSGRYVVTATGSDYAPSADTVEVSLTTPGRADFELNGLPRLESWTVNTAHVSRWWPVEDLFQMEIAVRATDADGLFDLSQVWLDIPTLGYSRTLQATLETGLFARTLGEGDLPTATIHALLGTPMELHATDGLLAEAISPSFQLVRVIDETPEATDEAFQFVSPNCLQSQSGSGNVPLVEWNALFLPYPFTHQVDVIRVDAGLETLVQRVTGIPADSTSAVVLPLPTGDYYWTVAVVDNFKNRSRSKQVGFCITQ